MQISANIQTFCCNLKIIVWSKSGWKQNCAWLYDFYFERNYDDLKSKSLCFLLNRNINFNKNDKKWKMENPRQFQKDEPCVSAHITAILLPYSQLWATVEEVSSLTQYESLRLIYFDLKVPRSLVTRLKPKAQPRTQ